MDSESVFLYGLNPYFYMDSEDYFLTDSDYEMNTEFVIREEVTPK